ncbi:MAG TPA: hypothetical protein PK198_03085 [Saprospiraceae bacterium]|nr:hypothetical protein [Saprospiraceae bacterium]
MVKSSPSLPHKSVRPVQPTFCHFTTIVSATLALKTEGNLTKSPENQTGTRLAIDGLKTIKII